MTGQTKAFTNRSLVTVQTDLFFHVFIKLTITIMVSLVTVTKQLFQRYPYDGLVCVHFHRRQQSADDRAATNKYCLRFNGHFPGEPELAGVY